MRIVLCEVIVMAPSSRGSIPQRIGTGYNVAGNVAKIEIGIPRRPPRRMPPSDMTEKPPVHQRPVTVRSLPALAVTLVSLGIPVASRGDGFDQNVRPLLQKHCLRCHGGAEAEG